MENSWVIVQNFSIGEDHGLYWKSVVTSTATGGRSYREPRTRSANIRFPVIQDLQIGKKEDLNVFYQQKHIFVGMLPAFLPTVSIIKMIISFICFQIIVIRKSQQMFLTVKKIEEFIFM